MFTVHVIGHGGVEAEFVVPNPVLALDLAMRADRVGLSWRAGVGSGEVRPLSLPALRELAEHHARSDPGHARHMDDVVRAEAAAAAAQLN